MSKKKQILKLVKYFSDVALDKKYKKKIKNIIIHSSIKELSHKQIKDIEDYFSGLGFKNINKYWHKYYFGKNSKFHKEYIPENLYYTKIEPSLNRISMYPAYLDKNLLSKLFVFVEQPITIIKNINNFYYSKKDKLVELNKAIDICSKHSEFVIKPSLDSGAGKNVQLFKNIFSNEKERLNSIRQLFELYKKDFIIQNVIDQNEKMKLLNKSSINTIRIMSYLKGSDVNIISSVVRVGRSGQFTDNTTLGGISCGIDSNGKLKKNAYDSSGKVFYKTDNGCVIDSFEIPNYNEIITIVGKLHKVMPNFKLISWDLAIDRMNKIVLIEFNAQFQEINFHQLNNGPLFGSLTEDILNKIPRF